VRMVAEVGDHDSEWAAMAKVAQLLGVTTPESVRKWGASGQGVRPGAVRYPQNTCPSASESEPSPATPNLDPRGNNSLEVLGC